MIFGKEIIIYEVFYGEHWNTKLEKIKCFKRIDHTIFDIYLKIISTRNIQSISKILLFSTFWKSNEISYFLNFYTKFNIDSLFKKINVIKLFLHYT